MGGALPPTYWLGVMSAITDKCLSLTNDAVVANSKVLPPVSNNDA
jgi:hypothetical protein